MGQLFAGRFELVDVLGHGGMGDIWRVWDRRDERYRAAKLQKQSDSASLLRFVRESSTRVEHPHVVAPGGWWAEDGVVLFTMPIIGGGSVAQLLADHGPLPHWWVRTLGLQLFEGLQAVHDAGLVHRDVKPANLLLEATGTGLPILRLSDFGIAVRQDEPRLTHMAQVVHTPGYSAPEVAGRAEPDPRQDLYSAGVVLAEMAAGEWPVDDPASAALSGPLARVIARLTATDPDARFATAEAARAGLVAIAVDVPDGEPIEVFTHLPPWPAGWDQHGPVPAAEVSRTRAARDPRRIPWAALALALLGVALLTSAWLTR